MARNNTLFILSGFMSLFLFSLLLFMFFYMLFASSNSKRFALKKDNYISISLEVATLNTKKFKKNVKISKEKVEAVAETKEIDVEDLFSDVWTKDVKIKKQKKKTDTKRLNQIIKKIKTKDKNSVKSVSELVNSNDSDKTADKDKKSSSGDEVNEYLAKIQAIVYKHFNPPENSQGHTVKAMIELSALGKVLDFRILNYSSNAALNQECDKIKGRLLGVLFPINPEEKPFRTIVNLKSQED